MNGEVPMKTKSMRKRTLLAVLLAMTLLLSSCSLIVKDEIADAKTPILKMGDAVVTKAEVQAQTNSVLYEMYTMYSYYGVNLDVTDPEVIASAQQTAVDNLKQDMVLRAKAKELGLDQLTEEEAAQVQETAQSNLDYARTYIQSYMLGDMDLEGEDLEKAIQDTLDELGVSLDDYVKTAADQLVDDKLRDYAVKDVTVPDEDVKAEYDSRVAADEEKYKEDADSWTSADRSGTTLYYTPAGIRRVKQILLRFKEEDETALDDADAKRSDANSKVNSLLSAVDAAQAVLASEEATQEEKDAANADLEAANADLETAQAELEAAQAEYDAVREAAFANLDPDADAILEALKEDPESWDELMAEKNEDTGLMEGAVNAEKGYALCEGMTGFDSAFMDAAMALQSVGDVSDKTASDLYGYYIIKYVGDDAEGPVDYDSVKDAIHDELLSDKQDETYTETLAQWIEAAGVKVDMGALND